MTAPNPLRFALSLLDRGETARALAWLRETGASVAGLRLLEAGLTVEAVCVMEAESKR